ncbi:hypothetical protein N338_10791, partial [Podiceps cristatus]
SLQTLELKAIVWTFEHWPHDPVNVVADSLYVVGVVQRLERAMIKEPSNQLLFELFYKLLPLLDFRTAPYFITHIRSHQLVNGLALGKNQADKLVTPVWTGPPVNTFEQARPSHDFFHQSVKMLARQFHISHSDTQGIVKSCPARQHIGYGIGLGVNHRGLLPLQLWPMDVTHIPEFGRQRYVHITIDAFSLAIWVMAQTGETARHVIRPLYMCFAVLGVPLQIKTDNGPAYTSHVFQEFCNNWGVRHATGIPHSPTRQAIVERAHQMIKNLLEKQ